MPATHIYIHTYTHTYAQMYMWRIDRIARSHSYSIVHQSVPLKRSFWKVNLPARVFETQVARLPGTPGAPHT